MHSLQAKKARTAASVMHHPKALVAQAVLIGSGGGLGALAPAFLSKRASMTAGCAWGLL